MTQDSYSSNAKITKPQTDFFLNRIFHWDNDQWKWAFCIKKLPNNNKAWNRMLNNIKVRPARD
jgi:hypothetical protein